MRVLTIFVVLASCMMSTGVHAQQIFKCKSTDGATVFSQRPCGTDAKEVVIRSSSPSPVDGEPVQAPAVNQAIADQAAYADRNSIDRRAASCRANTEDNVRRPSQQRVAQYRQRIAALEDRIGRANNNLAGATWEAGMREEIAALHGSIATESASAESIIAQGIRRCDETQQREIEAFDESRKRSTPSIAPDHQ